MAVDIVAKLLLQTEEYQKNLKSARDEMKSFEEKVGTVKEGILKFAGVIGVATTAQEAFKKMIESSDTLSDMYEENVRAMTDIVDNFFYAIGNGDWTPLFSGLQNTIQLAKEAAGAMDELGDTKRSYGYFNTRNTSTLQNSMMILRDKTSSKAERDKAKKDAKAAIADQQEITDSLVQSSQEAMNALVRETTGFSGLKVDVRAIEKVWRLNVSAGREAAKKVLKQQFKQFQKEAQVIKSKYTTVDVSAVPGSAPTMVETTNYKALSKDIQPLLNKYKDAILYNGILVRGADEYRDTLISIGEEANNAETNLSSMTRSYNKASQSKQPGTTGTKSKKKDTGPVGSDLYIKSEITKLQTEMEKATTDGARFGFQKAIDEFQLILDRHAFAAKMKPMLDESYYRSFQSKPDLTPKTLKGTLDAGLKPIIKETDVKNTMLYNDALGQTFNTMLAISNVTSKGAAGWISYGVNAMTALNQTYMSLVKVIPALEIKAVAEGAGSAAQAPIVGWIAAIAAIGSMVAAFASLPKYATGGIIDANSGVIPGNQFSGDKVLARVNSGELILNKAQQRNIAAQLSENRVQRLDVNFVGRVSGRDIEFVLDRRAQFKRNAL